MRRIIRNFVCAAITVFIICISTECAAAVVFSGEATPKTYMVEADSASIACKKLNIKKTSGANMAFAPKDTEVTIIADSKTGYRLAGWEVTEYGDNAINTTPYTADGNSINITVYDKNIKIQPIYERQAYTVTVSNSTLISNTDSFYRCGSTKFTVNASLDEVIKVRALNKIGYKVYKWEVTVIDSDSDGKLILSSFDAALGSNVLELKISSFNYEINPIYIKNQYELYVGGFNTDIDGVELRKGTEGAWCMTDWGTSVTATAKEIEGKRFNKWEISGVELSDAIKRNPILTFEMPLSDVKLNAVYTDIAVPVQSLPQKSEENGGILDIIIIAVSLLLGVFLVIIGKSTNKRKT